MNRKLKLFLMMLAAILIIQTAVAGAEVFTHESYTDYQFAEGTVSADRLNLRQGPSLDSHILAVLERGEPVRVLGQLGEWFVVYSPKENIVGVLHKDYINTTIPVSVPDPEDNNDQASEEIRVIKVNATDEERQLLELVNQERAKAGIPLLEFENKVMDSARLKAKDMSENGYFSHESPRYGSPFDSMKAAKIQFKYAGENIAGNSTVKDAFNAMMKDEGSRNNILNPKFTHTGIGIEPSSKYGLIVVQQFYGN